MSFLGGLVHGITSVTKLVPGPIGVLSSAVNAATASRPSSPALPLTSATTTLMPTLSQGQASGYARGPSFSFGAGPGGVNVQASGPQYGLTVTNNGALLPKGYHENKTLQRARIMQQNRGGLTPGMQRAVNNVVNALVKNRSMNVLNGHAARRSIRRVKGVVHVLRRIERALPHRTVHKRSFGRRK